MTNPETPEEIPDAPVPLRHRAAIYASGVFNGNVFHMGSVILPLWALSLDPSPLMIGLFLGCRQILPVLLSIHGGALMDRFGARRVMLVFGLVGAASFALFPAFPSLFAAAVVLQMLSGLAESINWIGTQALLGQVLKGSPADAGRMAFVMRIGGFAGPPLIGGTWDLFGPWGAFGALSAWVACGWLAAWMVPSGTPSTTGPKEAVGKTPAPSMRWRDVLPRISDYVTTFRLLAIPTVALVAACTILRQSGSAVQSSFYVVWLDGIGISGTAIGMLLGVSAAVAAPASLAIGPLSRRFGAHNLLLFMVIVSVITISITPLLGTYLLLLVAIGVRGGSQGMNLPLMMSLTATTVDRQDQGKGMALRITINRASSMVVPIIMGAVAEAVGLENSFFIIGGIGVLMLAFLAVWVARSPAFKRPG
jgi:MFS family permease